jgi:ribosome-binding protein aMBF1 (putative translation factor)
MPIETGVRAARVDAPTSEEARPKAELPPAAEGKTRDAVAILERRFIEGDPTRALRVEEVALRHDIAQAVYDFREASGLSQEELAEKVGISPRTVDDLEAADYDGHALAMLRHIGRAFGQRVELRLIPCGGED